MTLATFRFPDPSSKNGGLERWATNEFGDAYNGLYQFIKLDDAFRYPSLDVSGPPTMQECADLLCDKAFEGAMTIRQSESAYMGLRLARTIGDLIISNDDVLDLSALHTEIEVADSAFIRRFSQDYLTTRPSLRTLVRSGIQTLHIFQKSPVAAHLMAGFTLAHIEACQLATGENGENNDAMTQKFAVLLEDETSIGQVLDRWQPSALEEG